MCISMTLSLFWVNRSHFNGFVPCIMFVWLVLASFVLSVNVVVMSDA